MAIVVLKLSDVKRKREDRPKKCPYCGGETFQRWGRVNKPVKDSRYRMVRVYRYRCCRCKRTFRHYPPGISVADQTERMKKLAELCWVLGLSYRHTEQILCAFGVQLSFMSVWRDVQSGARQVVRRNHWRPVRVLGLDGAYVLGWGEKRPVLVAVDMGNGVPVALGYVDEYSPQAVQHFLEPLVQRLGVSVIVTDDLMSYRQVAERMALGHQVCQFHVRRWVNKAIRELHKTLPEEWHGVLEEVRQLIDELPPEGHKRLYALWKQLGTGLERKRGSLRPVDQLRDLLIRLSQQWGSYITFYGEPEIPWTNNATERAIGRMKMRARTVRGYKNWSGMHNGLLLSGTTCN